MADGTEREGDAQHEHHGQREPPHVEDRQREEHVHRHEHHRADDHQRGPLADAVVDRTEERREQNRAEGQDRRNVACDRGRDVVFVDHDLGGELQEGEDARVEHQTQQGDQPEALAGNDLTQIGEFETLLGLVLCGGDRGVEPPVHHAVRHVGQQPDAERQRAEEHGVADAAHRAGDRQTRAERGGRADARHGHLQTERQRQFVAREPLDDHLRDGDAADLGPHAEGGEAQTGHPDLRLESPQFAARGEQRRDGVGLQQRTADHQPAGHQPREAHAHLVEDDAAQQQHEQEDVEPAVGAREPSVLDVRPPRGALDEQVFERGHDVGDEVAAHHRERDDQHRRPAGGRRLAQFAFDCFCH